jgi:hypothetical protein
MDRDIKVRVGWLIFGLLLSVTGVALQVLSSFTFRVFDSVGLSAMIIGLIICKVARRKGFIIWSILAGFLIIISVPHAWFIGVGVMMDGFLLSQLLQNRWPYSNRTKPSTRPA